MIELSQMAEPSVFNSTHYLMTDVGEGVRHWVITGVADLSGKFQESGELRREWVLLTLLIPGIKSSLVRVQQWAPFVSLGAVETEGDAMRAGWAVESFHLMDGDLHQVPAQPGQLMRTATLGCGIKVRAVEGCVLRLGYALHLAGTLEAQPLQ